MTRRWQYLTVTHVRFAVAADGDKPQAWDDYYFVLRPGAEDAETHKEIDTARPVLWRDLLNELGQEGWELVTSDVLDHAVVSTSLGWSDVSTPVRVRYAFKREC